MSNYFYDSQSLGRPKRQQTFTVYQEDHLQKQLRKPFRPISNVFDYNIEPSNINSTQFVDGPSLLSGPHYNRKLTRHHSISGNPQSSVRYLNYPTYKPDPPVINSAFLEGGVLRPKLFVDEHGFVIEEHDDDELTRSLSIPITQSVAQFRQPPSMTSNPTRHQYPQYEYSSLNPTTTKPNFHLTKNVQSQLARLSAPVIANSHPYEQQFDEPSLQFRTTPRLSLNPENHRHSNSSADSSSTLVFSSPGSSIHYSSGSDMSSAPNVASLSSSLYYVDCGGVGGVVGGGAGTHHSYPGSTADSNRSSICSNSTLTQSSIESHQHEEGADPEPLPPPPPDLVNPHELVDSLPLPPPPLQSEQYNRPLSPAPPPPVSIVSLTTTTQPNLVAAYLDQTPLPPAPTLNHEVVTTLRRKHFTTDDSQHYHYPMSTFTNTGTLTHRRPAPPPPPSRAPHHVGSVSSNMSSSSPSPSTSSSSGISDSSSRSSGNSSHCSPSSMSTSFTSSTTSSNCAYDQPKVNMTSPSNLSIGIIPSPDYISPMLNVDPHGNPESEVTFNKRKSNSPTYGWVYQEPQSPSIAATNSEENLTSSTNSTHVHLDTFSMSDPGSRFTTMDRNNNSKNQQNPTTYVYNNSAFVHENRIQKDDEDNRIKAKLNNPSYTLFLDDPSVVSRELSELNGGGGSSALNDQLLGPNGTKQPKSLPASFECCVRVTRCFTIFVCVLLLFFMLGVIGFTLYGRYNGGDTDGLSFWRRFFPLPISDNSTISTLSTTIASNLTSTTMFSTISTTLAPTLVITTTAIPTVVLVSTTTNSSIPINTPINSNQSELSTLAPIQTTTTLFNQSESTIKFINQSESTSNFANQSELSTQSTNQSNVTFTTLSPIQSEQTTIISTSQPETLVNQSDFTTPSSSSSLSTINSTVQPTNLTNFDFLNIPNDTIPVNEPVILNVTLLPFTTTTTSPTNQTIVPSPSDALPIIVQSTKTELNNDSLVTTTEQSRNHHPTLTTSSPLDTDITTNLPNSTVTPSSNVNSSTNYPNSQFANDANVTSSTTTTTTGATKIFDDFIIDDLQGGSVGTTSTISTLTTTFTSDDVVKTNELDRNSTNDERDSRSMEIDDKNSNNESSVNSVSKDDSSDLINVDALDSFINDIFADHNQTTVEKSTSEVVNSTDESIPNSPNLTTSTQAPKNSTPFEINYVNILPNISENISSVPETTTTTTTITTFMNETFIPEMTTTSIPANISTSLPAISTTSSEYSISSTNVSDATSSSTTETKSSAKPTESSTQESTTLSFSESNSTASSDNSDNIHENLEKLFDEFFTNKEETF